MKRYILLAFLSILLGTYFIPNNFCYAEDGSSYERVYVYDENGNLLIEKSGAEIGDEYLDEDFCQWEICKKEDNIAIAKKVGQNKKPHVKTKSSQKSMDENKRICLYMTHNDESFVPSDGYDSIYGAGGIHDVAYAFKIQLENLGIKTVLDESLHIPHNSSAYSRSKVTASNLQNRYSPDGLFDLHRDGVAKSVYVSENENMALSKIRIVVGKSNPNFEENYAFAKEIFSVGQALYPWLFLDIYLGKGTYNQNLQQHALLFEMGTYLIEKEYVLNSAPFLANVIDTVLFKTSAEENGDIVIDEEAIDNLEEDYENRNNFTENDENLPKNTQKSIKNAIFWTIFAILSTFAIFSVIAFSVKIHKKNRTK